MALHHTPLDANQLSPAIAKALATPANRAMAARGAVPLPPGELATVLYQLSLDDDSAIAEAARGTLAGLPERVVLGAVSDAGADPRVLDALAPRCLQVPALFDAILLNPVVSDETIETFAQTGTDKQVDRLATNEERLLRAPAIIAAMYTNPRARMSTVDRAVELAVREGVRVPGLAAWDEIARALTGGGSSTGDDAVFAQAAAASSGDDSELTTGDEKDLEVDDDGQVKSKVADDDEKIPLNRMTIPAKVRLATLGNAFARAQLIRDPSKLVATAVVKSPGMTDIEAARFAGNHSLPEEVIKEIARRRDWTKGYTIKLTLVMNPKTPIAEASRFLPMLHERHLRQVSRSKGIPSALAAQARKLVMQRGGKGDK